jgi:hypothetical protein
MQKTVIFDSEGNIVGLGPAPIGWPDGATVTPPKPIAGQTVAFIEVPEEYANKSHRELFEHLRVDVTAERPKFIRKPNSESL